MTTYPLLLRGINVGGKNKVVMSDLRQLVVDLGYENVQTYINSGNLFFKTDKSRKQICQDFEALFAQHYPFVQHFSLFSAEEYAQDYETLPNWWSQDLARKDVLFFTEKMDKEAVVERIQTFPLHNEVLHVGKLGIYWGKYDEAEFLKTSYHKHLLKEAFYKEVTIRNAKTAQKFLDILQD